MSVTAPHRTFTEEDVTAGLLAVIAWAGNASAAARALEAEGKLKISSGTLSNWAKHLYVDRFNELRDKYSEQLEAQLVHEYRDVARQAVEVQRLGLERAHERLEANKDQDPSRTAANASTVADKMTRNLLALSGRPTSIREDRNAEEIIRSLMAKGILALPEGASSGDARAES